MRVSFQGTLGAYSHITAQKNYPNADYVGCKTFADAINLVKTGLADCAVIPIKNSTAGKVHEAYEAVKKSNLFIIGEYDLRVRHQLWGLKEATLNDIKEAYSHPQALAQCTFFLEKNGIKSCKYSDTATSSQDIIKWQDKSKAAIASELAGELYGLHKLAENIENLDDNTTHFVILSTTPKTTLL